MSHPFSKDCLRILENSRLKAREGNEEFIATEHVLFALLSDGGPLVKRLLDPFKPRLDEALSDLFRSKDSRDPPLFQDVLPISPRLRMTQELAEQFRVEFKMAFIEPEHLLLGLLMEPDSMAGLVLKRSGVLLDDVGRRLTKLYRGGE